MTGYTRNDTADNIADGKVINASDLDGEFNAVQAAFDATAGHTHDGTTGGGAQIDYGDLANLPDLTNAAITGGAIDGATIGATTPASGAFTALSASGNVTLSGGTANGVAYLNGSKVLTSGSALTFDGTSLGIGTATPLQLLHLSSASSPKMQITYQGVGASQIGIDAGSALTFGLDTSNGATERMRLTSTGLGIGTSSPTSKLDVAGTITADGLTVNSGNTSSNVTIRNSGTSYLNIYSDVNGVSILDVDANNTGAAPRFQIDVGDVQVARFSEGGDISFYEDTGTTAKFFWDASAESLGIGTSSPSDKLHLSFTSYPTIKLEDTGLSSSFIMQTHSGTQQHRITGTGAYPVVIRTNDIERARIDSSGNVGIGTSSPKGRLDISTSDAGITPNTGADELVVQSSGATGITIGSGTSSTASIYFADSGNATRGWMRYFHASNYLDFGTAGTERLRIDSSGNLGLGVTPSAWGNLLPLQIGQGASFVGAETSNSAYIASNGYYDAAGAWRYIGTGTAGQYRLAGSDGSHAWFTAPSGTAGNAISFTQAMTLDASGRLGIGTSSPSVGLNVQTNTSTVSSGNYPYNLLVTDNRDYNSTAPVAGGGIGFGFKYTSAGTVATGPTIQGYKENTTDGDYGGGLRFLTRAHGSVPAERARIDSSGNLLVGTTSSIFTATKLQVVSSTTQCAGFKQEGGAALAALTTWNSATSGTRYHLQFADSSLGVIRGSITSDGTSVAYNTSSDYRLKQDWVAVSDASTRVKALKPVNFAWKADGKRVDGFLAHELADVVPEAVTGEKDAVDADGNPVYQGIDQSKLVPLLTAALQEALVEIESLKTRLTAAGL